ncbi:MAG: hypothetical protein K6F99_02615 [Lachnospiraceae bacterium]|nr:hypothetical protein [Lachnospiraceae bacterium]
MSENLDDILDNIDPNDPNVQALEKGYNELTEEQKEQIQGLIEKGLNKGSSDQSFSKLKYEKIENPELTVSYNADTKEFRYSYPDGSSFLMNIPFGSFSNDSVYIKTIQGGSTHSSIKDYLLEGKSFIEQNGDDGISGIETVAFGSYGVSLEAGSYEELHGKHYTSHISFRVVDKDKPLQINMLRPPYGYRIKSLELNGNPVDTKDDYMILKSDGDYSAVFTSASIKNAPELTVSFKRDTTAPYMIFSENIEKEVNNTLYFTPSEEDAFFSLTLNGEEMDTTDLEGVAANGSYSLTVSDTYGNSTDYEFFINKSDITPIFLLLGIVIVLLAMSAFIIIMAKRTLKIR